MSSVLQPRKAHLHTGEHGRLAAGNTLILFHTSNTHVLTINRVLFYLGPADELRQNNIIPVQQEMKFTV